MAQSPDAEALSAALLAWYDRHARDLPWRTSPAARAAGVRPDPYRVWLSEIMLQQTTVATVGRYYRTFTERWPTVGALAAAPLDDVLTVWAGLGYYARARNLHACARMVAERHEGRFPEEEAGLRALPGIGAYTAAAIMAIAFDRPATVVDGNVERVISRLRRIETPLPDSKPEISSAAAAVAPERRPGDYAQALMDLGATVCTPTSPACGVCPWMAACAARRAGVAPELPRKRKKAPKPTRQGWAFLALDAHGRVLLRRRPEKGLLGGMLGLPGTDWVEDPLPPAEGAAAPFSADWRRLEAEARHTFTHFHLRLALIGARVPGAEAGPDDRWIPRAALDDQALPTLFKKALKLGLTALDDA